MADPTHIIQKEYKVPVRGLVHVGSYTGGVFDSYLSHGIEHVLYIEPSPKPYADLSRRIAGQAGHESASALCLDVSGVELDFNVMTDPSLSSVLRPSQRLLDTGVRVDEKLRMSSKTIDDVVLDRGRGFNVINITVPGSELRILAGAHRTLKSTAFVYLTLDQRGNFEGESSIEAVNWYLKGMGFRLLQYTTNFQGHGELLYIHDENVMA